MNDDDRIRFLRSIAICLVVGVFATSYGDDKGRKSPPTTAGDKQKWGPNRKALTLKDYHRDLGPTRKTYAPAQTIQSEWCSKVTNRTTESIEKLSATDGKRVRRPADPLLDPAATALSETLRSFRSKDNEKCAAKLKDNRTIPEAPASCTDSSPTNIPTRSDEQIEIVAGIALIIQTMRGLDNQRNQPNGFACPDERGQGCWVDIRPRAIEPTEGPPSEHPETQPPPNTDETDGFACPDESGQGCWVDIRTRAIEPIEGPPSEHPETQPPPNTDEPAAELESEKSDGTDTPDPEQRRVLGLLVSLVRRAAISAASTLRGWGHAFSKKRPMSDGFEKPTT
jgi:hypothetical protein